MLSQTFSRWLGTVGGTAGLALLAKYLIDVFVAKQRREAENTAIEIDTDARRVQMADTIINQYKETIDFLKREMESMRDEQSKVRDINNALRERIEILEKTLLANYIPLPPYTTIRERKHEP